MRIEPNIAPVASLFGEPSRAAILIALMDGRALPAGELARVAGLAPTAASGHLAKLPLALSQPRLSPAAGALRHARSCYNHLAGELAVAIALALEERGYLRRGEDKRYELGGESARHWFVSQGINFQSLRPGRHGLARQCLDWTERRPHLAGPLGASLFRCWCDQGWLTQSRKHPRLVETTSLGRRKLREQLGLQTAFSRIETSS